MDALYPEDLKYTEAHEWAKLSDQTSAADQASSPVSDRSKASEVAGDDAGGHTVRIGITSFAQEALGDIVFVTMPPEGEAVEAGQSVGEVESTKSVSDLYAPVSGTVVATNHALESQPELINADPYGEGWILEISVEDPEQLAGLLDAAAYSEHVGAA